MLKIKKELNYRRGYTDRHCEDCDHYVAAHPIKGINGANLGTQPRCPMIGMNPGRQYRVHPNNICDRFDQTKRLERLKRGCQL